MSDEQWSQATPVDIDKLLWQNSIRVEKWDLYTAWHKAVRDWRATRLAIAEARATMSWDGPVGKAKAYAITQTEQERIDLDIAQANLDLCEKRSHTLKTQGLNLHGRNKNIMQAYGQAR